MVGPRRPKKNPTSAKALNVPVHVVEHFFRLGHFFAQRKKHMNSLENGSLRRTL